MVDDIATTSRQGDDMEIMDQCLDSDKEEDERTAFLRDLGVPFGLRHHLLHPESCAMERIWIIDNSGSMTLHDGHSSSHPNHSDTNTAFMTRWDEVQETTTVHVQLASALQVPSEFRLLNTPDFVKKHQNEKRCFGLFQQTKQKKKKTNEFWVPETTTDSAMMVSNTDCCRVRFRVGHPKDDTPSLSGHTQKKQQQKQVQHATQLLHKIHKPKGKTPLANAIRQVGIELRHKQQQQQPTKDLSPVALMIVTDGSNNNEITTTSAGNDKASFLLQQLNQELVDALESLQDLPIHVVIRLCTDYQSMIEFYNHLDTQASCDPVPTTPFDTGDCDSNTSVASRHKNNRQQRLYNVDVLDDHLAEAKEVCASGNTWLNYALLFHRLREMGQSHELFDLIDERALTKNEIQDFCQLLFGNSVLANEKNEDEADEISSWQNFLDRVERAQAKERMHWNPLTNQMAPWIDIGQLRQL